MANYINLTLDTIAPQGISVTLNDGVTSTTTTAVTLAVDCNEAYEASLEGIMFQMKIWGTSSAPTEDDAQWETYQATKQITLPEGDGIKTVYVKIRDDVWNETEAASDTITLHTKLPSVTISNVSASKLSLVTGKNTSNWLFITDEAASDVKIMIVSNVNAEYNDPSNISIPTTNGSYIKINDSTVLSGDCLESENINIADLIEQRVYVNANDINTASPGDGVKIIKVFVKSSISGAWSK